MKRILVIILIIILTFSVLFFARIRYNPKPDFDDENRTVYVKRTENGHVLYKNGIPFQIKGASGNGYLKELAEAGGNTIRKYDTLNLERFLLDAEKNNISVIVDIPIPAYNQHFNFYSSQQNREKLKNDVQNIILKYKNHPSILMWNVGNELHYPFVLWKNDFIRTFNSLIDIIHKTDPNHPVCTSIGGVSRAQTLGIRLHSKNLDLLSFNTFGNTKDINVNLDQIVTICGRLPYLISEWGSDGSWESKKTAWGAPIEQTSSKKAEQIRERFFIIKNRNDKNSLGTLVFFWGNKHECTYTWFSLFMENKKSEIVNEISNLWFDPSKTTKFIGLDYMLVNDKGATDNILLNANSINTAELFFNQHAVDSLFVKWEIYPEEWHFYLNTDKGIPQNSLMQFESFKTEKVTFKSPEKEGPYRLFAYVFNKDGIFSATNTPFYVLTPDEKSSNTN